MKITAIILTTLILLLTLEPGFNVFTENSCNQTQSCKDSCSSTSKKEIPSNSKEDNNCNEKSCNPFQVCSSCFLICEHQTFNYQPILQTFLVRMFGINFIFIKQQAADIWQPPKIV